MRKVDNKTSKKNSIVAMLIFVLLGVVVALQFKSVSNTKKEQAKSASAEILQYEEKIKELEKKIANERESKEALQSRYNSEMNYLYNNEKQFIKLFFVVVKVFFW